MRTRRGKAGRISLVLAAVLLLAGCDFQLGGASNTFGNDPTPGGTRSSMWAAVNGPFSLAQDGDPYDAKCAGKPVKADTCGDQGRNADYDPSGEVYAVDIATPQVGSPVTVSIYDPSFDAGDAAGDDYYTSPFAVGFSTWYRMYDTTGDANDVSLDPSLALDKEGRCAAGTGSAVFAPGTASVGAWAVLCTFTPTEPGIYPVEVRTSGIPHIKDAGGGSNSFSIRAVSTATNQPVVYALNRMSVMVPAADDVTSGGGSAQLYLASLSSVWAGHTIVLDVFDPGDATGGNVDLQLLAPPSGAPASPPTGGDALPCNYSAPSPIRGEVPTDLSSSTCEIQVKSSNRGMAIYNGEWLRISLAVPLTYSCSTDCWWTLRYSFDGATPSQPVTINDRITAILDPPS